jgi:hypothetical protein
LSGSSTTGSARISTTAVAKTGAQARLLDNGRFFVQ